ncbi:hypothetical protein T12_8572 [Trichinella patagoniensis]|uniref:Uncharacterized protein n=1 Tax=Trichinella patagoniensis TaxID=990121 RepID=A0A0V1AEB7_9BILA|nr:hypothetical protein T12_8572 [Trichinella patagoniensis]
MSISIRLIGYGVLLLSGGHLVRNANASFRSASAWDSDERVQMLLHLSLISFCPPPFPRIELILSSRLTAFLPLELSNSHILLSLTPRMSWSLAICIWTTSPTVGNVVRRMQAWFYMARPNAVKRNGKNVVGEKAEQASQRTTTTADIPVSYKSNRNRHRRAILTDRTRKKAHLDDRRLIFKMARSMLLTGHENGCQRKDTQR